MEMEDLGVGLCCPEWTSDEAEAMEIFTDEFLGLDTNTLASFILKGGEFGIGEQEVVAENQVCVSFSSLKQRTCKQRKSSKISEEMYNYLQQLRQTLPKKVECPFCHESDHTRFYDFNNYMPSQARYKCKECDKRFTYGRQPRARKPVSTQQTGELKPVKEAKQKKRPAKTIQKKRPAKSEDTVQKKKRPAKSEDTIQKKKRPVKVVEDNIQNEKLQNKRARKNV